MLIGRMRKDQVEAAIVKTVKMLASKGIKVTQRGSGAYCAWDKKGNVILINIPMLPDEPTQEFMDALQGYMDHEVAHALYTNSLEGEELERQSTLNTSPSAKQMLHMFANVVEDVRIEATVPKHFPGAEANLNKLRSHIIDTVWRPECIRLQAEAALDPTKLEQLKGQALIPYLRGLGGQKLCADMIRDEGLEPLFAPLLAAIPDLQHRLKTMASTADAVRLAELIMKVNMPPQEATPPEQDAGDEPEQPKQPQPKQEKQEKPDDQGDSESDQGDDAANETNGEDGEEQGDTDKKGKGKGDPDKDDDDAGDGDTDDASGRGEGQDDDADTDDDDADQGDGSDDDDGDGGDSDDADNEGDDASDDGDAGSKGKANMSLAQAMRRLDPAQRRALYLYNNHKKTVEEIADKMNSDVATVTDLLKNGRRNLARLMNGGK